MMDDSRRRCACLLSIVLAAGCTVPARASDTAFPFDQELMLDVSPMHGSKQVPMLEVDDNGVASIDLWCGRLQATADVGADSITIVPKPAEPASCTPERQSSNDSLLAALSQVTSWRRSGEVLELIGATTLRFRLMTN